MSVGSLIRAIASYDVRRFSYFSTVARIKTILWLRAFLIGGHAQCETKWKHGEQAWHAKANSNTGVSGSLMLIISKDTTRYLVGHDHVPDFPAGLSVI
eukprot:6194200-Pleurochrysis_carterae.AAC.1